MTQPQTPSRPPLLLKGHNRATLISLLAFPHSKETRGIETADSCENVLKHTFFTISLSRREGEQFKPCFFTRNIGDYLDFFCFKLFSFFFRLVLLAIPIFLWSSPSPEPTSSFSRPIQPLIFTTCDTLSHSSSSHQLSFSPVNFMNSYGRFLSIGCSWLWWLMTTTSSEPLHSSAIVVIIIITMMLFVP